MTMLGCDIPMSTLKVKLSLKMHHVISFFFNGNSLRRALAESLMEQFGDRIIDSLLLSRDLPGLPVCLHLLVNN